MSPVSAMVTPVASHVSVLRQSTVLMEEPPEESDLSLDEIKEEIVEVIEEVVKVVRTLRPEPPCVEDTWNGHYFRDG